MPALVEAATRKVGPLPAWGWGAVIVGGYLGYRVLRGGGSSRNVGVAVDETTAPSGGGGGTTGPTLPDIPVTSNTVPQSLLDQLAALQSGQQGIVDFLNNQPPPTPPLDVPGIIDASNRVSLYQQAIAKISGYITTLRSIQNPTTKQQASLTADLAAYEADKVALAQAQHDLAIAYGSTEGNTVSGTQPTFSFAPQAGISVPAPNTAAPPVDYSAAIAKLNTYIANLSADKTPTTQQTTELALYRARLADYSTR